MWNCRRPAGPADDQQILRKFQPYLGDYQKVLLRQRGSRRSKSVGEKEEEVDRACGSGELCGHLNRGRKRAMYNDDESMTTGSLVGGFRTAPISAQYHLLEQAVRAS